MRKTHIGTCVWAVNLLLMVGGVALAAGVVQADRPIPKLQVRPDNKPIWRATATQTGPPVLLAGPLSPRERPRATVDVTNTERAAVAEPTEEELRARVTERIRSTYKLELVAYSSIKGKPSMAFVTAAGERLQLFEGTNLNTSYGNKYDQRPESPAVVDDIVVTSIYPERIILRAHSIVRPALVVDVSLELPPAVELIEHRWFSGRSEGAGLLNAEPERVLPEWPSESHYDKKNDIWQIGRTDFEALPAALARYARVVMANDGNATGVQVSSDLPADSPIRKLGGRPGDLLKAVNGISVRGMSDLRRVIRREYEAGKRKFVLEIERDGVIRRQTFRTPG